MAANRAVGVINPLTEGDAELLRESASTVVEAVPVTDDSGDSDGVGKLRLRLGDAAVLVTTDDRDLVEDVVCCAVILRVELPFLGCVNMDSDGVGAVADIERWRAEPLRVGDEETAVAVGCTEGDAREADPVRVADANGAEGVLLSDRWSCEIVAVTERLPVRATADNESELDGLNVSDALRVGDRGERDESGDNVPPVDE